MRVGGCPVVVAQRSLCFIFSQNICKKFTDFKSVTDDLFMQESTEKLLKEIAFTIIQLIVLDHEMFTMVREQLNCTTN